MGMGSTLFTRIVPADKGRGWVMLLSWDRPVVQRTAFQMSTLGTADRKNRDRVIAAAREFYRVSEHVECTDAATEKRLLKLYPQDAAAESDTPAE